MADISRSPPWLLERRPEKIQDDQPKRPLTGATILRPQLPAPNLPPIAEEESFPGPASSVRGNRKRGPVGPEVEGSFLCPRLPQHGSALVSGGGVRVSHRAGAPWGWIEVVGPVTPLSLPWGLSPPNRRGPRQLP